MDYRGQQQAMTGSMRTSSIDFALVRTRLLDEQGEVVARMEVIQQSIAIDIGDGDGMLTDAQERGQALAALLTEHLHQIEQALARLDDGSYGSCARCSSAIPPRRLEVLPLATLCVNCQAATEQQPAHRR